MTAIVEVIKVRLEDDSLSRTDRALFEASIRVVQGLEAQIRVWEKSASKTGYSIPVTPFLRCDTCGCIVDHSKQGLHAESHKLVP